MGSPNRSSTPTHHRVGAAGRTDDDDLTLLRSDPVAEVAEHRAARDRTRRVRGARCAPSGSRPTSPVNPTSRPALPNDQPISQQRHHPFRDVSDHGFLLSQWWQHKC